MLLFKRIRLFHVFILLVPLLFTLVLLKMSYARRSHPDQALETKPRLMERVIQNRTYLLKLRKSCDEHTRRTSIDPSIKNCNEILTNLD